MPIPEYKDLADALLCYVFFNGGDRYQINAKDAYSPLADYFNLSKDERTRPRPDGYHGKEWENKVQWTRQRLINHGYMESRGRGIWGLTNSGLNRANTISNKYATLKYSK